MVAPHGNANEGLGAGGADEETAVFGFELLAVVDEELLDLVARFKRCFLLWGGIEIDDNLRRFLIEAGEIFERLVSFGDDFGNHKAG